LLLDEWKALIRRQSANPCWDQFFAELVTNGYPEDHTHAILMDMQAYIRAKVQSADGLEGYQFIPRGERFDRGRRHQGDGRGGRGNQGDVGARGHQGDGRGYQFIPRGGRLDRGRGHQGDGGARGHQGDARGRGRFGRGHQGHNDAADADGWLCTW